MLRRLLTVSALFVGMVLAQGTPIVWSEREKPIYDQIRTLRSVPGYQAGSHSQSNWPWTSANCLSRIIR